MIISRETLKNSEYTFRATYLSEEMKKNKALKYCYPPHIHDSFIEIEVIFNGNMHQTINGKSHRLESGSIVILRPGDYHSLEISPEAELITIHFLPQIISKELLHTILNYEENITYTFSESDAKGIIANSMQLLEEFNNKNLFFENISKNIIENICCSTMRNLSSACISEKIATPMQKAILHLRTAFMNDPSLEEISRFVYLNPTYFSRTFKKHTGVSYNTFLTQLKLDYAKKLLCETSMTITDICFNAGFGSLSNFSRKFKEHFGMSAAKMRSCHGEAKAKTVQEAL